MGWPMLPLHHIVEGKCSCGHEPCRHQPGKHPRTRHGVKDATTDEKTLRRWWKRWPKANVAVATGSASGLFMLGPDGPQGIAALADLEREQGKLPRTPSGTTGGGGKRYYFRWPARGGVSNHHSHRGLPIDV